MKLNKIQIVVLVVLAVVVACTGILNYQAALLYGDDGGKISVFGKLSLIARLSLSVALVAYIKAPKYITPVIIVLMFCCIALGWWFTLGNVEFLFKNYWYIVLSGLAATSFYFWSQRNA